MLAIAVLLNVKSTIAITVKNVPQLAVAVPNPAVKWQLPNSNSLSICRLWKTLWGLLESLF